MAEVVSCFSMYKNLFPAREWQPRRVLLTGGGAELGGLPEFVEARLDMPGGRAALLLESAVQEQPGRFAVAAGLAVLGLSSRPAGISLLPVKTADELRFRRQKPLWIAAGATAAMILAVSLVSGYRDIRRKENELKAQRISLARRQDLAGQIEKTQARIAVLRSMADMVGRDLRAGSRVRELIEVIARSKSREDVITAVADAESYLKGGSGEEAAERRAMVALDWDKDGSTTNLTLSAFERVLIEGYSRRSSFTTVRDLISRLKQQSFVISADLLSDELVPEAETPSSPRGSHAQRFVIDVRMKAP
jgi:hypothetical protein